jgi:hypothetical protein
MRKEKRKASTLRVLYVRGDLTTSPYPRQYSLHIISKRVALLSAHVGDTDRGLHKRSVSTAAVIGRQIERIAERVLWPV